MQDARTLACARPTRFRLLREGGTMVSPTTMAAVRASGAIPNADYLLSAEGIRKEFPGVVALDDVQFKL